MNVSEQARQAYGSPKVPIRTHQATEAQLISQVTAKIRRAAADTGTFAALADALHENRLMWTTFAATVADKNNKLPEELRAQIFYLAEFTEHHTRLVLGGKDTVQPLIDINTAVMRGLHAQASR